MSNSQSETTVRKLRSCAFRMMYHLPISEDDNGSENESKKETNIVRKCRIVDILLLHFDEAEFSAKSGR